jgi:hypothetical protein
MTGTRRIRISVHGTLGLVLLAFVPDMLPVLLSLYPEQKIVDDAGP